jgi:hypothetical protein
MLKVRLAVASLGIALMLPAASAQLAQTANITPAAPLPSQIFTAKKVFISNVGKEFLPGIWSGGPDRTYNEFYAAIKMWGRYDLVATPADADMVLEISFSNPIAWVGGGSSSNTPHFCLVLLDPKTHITLWTLNEETSISHLQKGRDKSLGETIAKLVGDLKALTNQSVPAAK